MKRSHIKLAITGLLFFSLSMVGIGQTLTTEQWTQDLDHLQTTIHKEYNHLFDKITAQKWDAALRKLRTEIPTLAPHQIKVGFTRLVSSFEYGHTQVPFSTLTDDGVLAVNLYHFEDGIYIEGVQKEDKKALGARVLKIGGMPIEKALEAIRPVVPAENDFYFKGYGLRFLTVPSVLHAQGITTTLLDKVSFTLEKEGSTFEYTFKAVPLDVMSRDYLFTTPNDSWVSARSQESTPLYLKELNERLYRFEYIKDTKTLYVRQSSVFNDEKERLQDFYVRLFEFIDTNDVEKLVYDVRLNGGGNNYNNKNLIKGLMARPKINKKGNFFYIIGRNTFSACQNLTNEIENYTEAIIIGEPTAENKNFWGDARPTVLPNSKIKAYLSYAWWQDMPQWENKDFTVPHLASSMTFEQYTTNQDPALEIALEYTDTGFILNPMQHLTDLFTAGKVDQMMQDGIKIAKNPAYKYYDFEKEFSEAAYRFFTQGDQETGLMIYSYVATIYPESSGAWYNLASSFEQAKNYDKAKMGYQKIIELNDNPILVRTAKKRLAKLEKR